MAKIYVGTCSWTDPTLLASGFYPSGINTPEKRLAYYAEKFPIVEVDSTYYSLPSERNAGLWVTRTPPNFIFNVKAFSLFTLHPTQPRALPKQVREGLGERAAEKSNLYYQDVPGELQDLMWTMFEQALLPLDSAGKLGAILFQFPQWFFPSDKNREHILTCQERLYQYHIAVEFRNGVWMSEKHQDETLGFLRVNHLSYVMVDEPQGFRSSVPPVAETTSDLAVIRLHGRNKENWEKKGISTAERFRHYYKKEELEEWVPRLASAADQVSAMHVLFNNCYGDYAVRNAQDMANLLRSLGLDVQDTFKEGQSP